MLRQEYVAWVHPIHYLKPNWLSPVSSSVWNLSRKQYSNTLHNIGVMAMPLTSSHIMALVRDGEESGIGIQWNRLITFAVIVRVDRQTDWQTNRFDRIISVLAEVKDTDKNRTSPRHGMWITVSSFLGIRGKWPQRATSGSCLSWLSPWPVETSPLRPPTMTRSLSVTSLMDHIKALPHKRHPSISYSTSCIFKLGPIVLRRAPHIIKINDEERWECVLSPFGIHSEFSLLKVTKDAFNSPAPRVNNLVQRAANTDHDTVQCQLSASSFIIREPSAYLHQLSANRLIGLVRTTNICMSTIL